MMADRPFYFCGFIFDLFRVYLADKDNFLNIVSAWEIRRLQRKKKIARAKAFLAEQCLAG
ncbi:hypothetical protein ACHWWK_06130 [Klebsiella pneumoniae]